VAHGGQIFEGILGCGTIGASLDGGRLLRDGLCGLSSCLTGMDLEEVDMGRRGKRTYATESCFGGGLSFGSRLGGLGAGAFRSLHQ